MYGMRHVIFSRFRPFLLIVLIQIIIFSPMLFASQKIIYIFSANNWMPFSPIQTPLDVTISSWTPVGFGGPSYHSPGFLLIYFLQSVFSNQYIAELIFLFIPYVIASFCMYFFL